MHFMCIIGHMITPHQFADAVGRAALQTKFNVGPTAVSNALRRGQFPASWYLGCVELAKAKRIECPAEMFEFKGASCTKGANATAAFQPMVRKT